MLELSQSRERGMWEYLRLKQLQFTDLTTNQVGTVVPWPTAYCVPSLENFNMLPVKAIAIFLAVLLLPGIAAAANVYKSKDEQGVVEYSDRPSPGAEKVEIKPNVIHLEKAKSPGSAAPAAKGVSSTARGSAGTSGGVVVGAERRRRAADPRGVADPRGARDPRGPADPRSPGRSGGGGRH